MKGHEFDRFVAALGQTTSRRLWLKTCLAGMAAMALGLHRRTGAAQDDSPSIRPSDEDARPLPNFPFLVAVPTDVRYASYAVDDELTGPPTRFRSIDAMPGLKSEMRSALEKGFQSAYAATIARAEKDDVDAWERAVTTVVFDLGSEVAAQQAREAYLATLIDDPLAIAVESDNSGGSQIALLGCEGGCLDFSKPTPSSEGATNELAVVGAQGQFLFDARLQRFDDGAINASEGSALARLVTSRLSGVTALTAPSATAGGAGLLRRLSRGFRRRTASSAAAQYAPEGLRDLLAARNSLPIFDFGDERVPAATQTLIVDGGDIVVRFGESPASAAARQRSAEDAFWVCGTDQPLPMTPAYRGGYDLSLSSIQSVFLSEDDAEEYLGETRERLERDRPLIDLSELETSDDEVRDVYEDGRTQDGFSYGCISHRILRLGDVAAILAVEVKATPQTDEEELIDLADVEDDLCPILERAADIFERCILSPDECRSAFPLETPGALEPTPSPTRRPECDEPLERCGGRCVDLDRDDANCGACNNVCVPGAACIQGGCQCIRGLTFCGAACVDLTEDVDHCGQCGIACSLDEYCADGQCACVSGDPHCGEVCCAEDEMCESGACVSLCPGMLCSGNCVDPMTNPNHCGNCGTYCDTGYCCGGYCTDVGSDASNCGGCGQTCGSGSCCDGYCVDTSSDPSNCGACFNGCGGLSCCSGSCTDTQSDNMNCGLCGDVCQPSDYCSFGACVSG